MTITRALIIAEPWISKILSGEKDWEMRSTNCSLRGPIGLVAKGTGNVVAIAIVTGCHGPLDQPDMLKNISHHCIPEEMILSGEVAKWNHAWILDGVQQLASPVPYQHKNGAVTWVSLGESTQKQLEKQLSNQTNTSVFSSLFANIRDKLKPQVKSTPEKTTEKIAETTTEKLMTGNSGRVKISQGNLNNNHIYLSKVISMFPEECVGGKNATEKAPQLMVVEFDKAGQLETDISGDKKIFRKRVLIKEFFKLNNIQANDEVVIGRVSKYHFKVSKAV